MIQNLYNFFFHLVGIANCIFWTTFFNNLGDLIEVLSNRWVKLLFLLRAAYIPVVGSARMRDVMMLPTSEKSFSRSLAFTSLGMPLIYKLASLIDGELGRANETWITNNKSFADLSNHLEF